MGRIGVAIARRLEAFGVPVVYQRADRGRSSPTAIIPSLIDMARDVDTLIVIVPGGAATRNMIDAKCSKRSVPKAF